jgi:uncharacterized protein HemY
LATLAEKLARDTPRLMPVLAADYNLLGRVCANEGKLDEAERFYRRACQLLDAASTAQVPTLIAYLRDHAWALDRIGRPHDAKDRRRLADNLQAQLEAAAPRKPKIQTREHFGTLPGIHFPK